MTKDAPVALEYSRYPLWLNHSKLSPVVVYDNEQEQEYLAKGYTLPGTADPHAYLVSKATEKMDDAIRTMHLDIERKIKAGLADIYGKLVDMIEQELPHREEYSEPSNDPNFRFSPTSVDSMVDSLTADIMDSVRQTSRGTNQT